MNLKEIKQIIDLMKRSDLSEFAVEEEGFKLRIRRGPTGVPVVSTAPHYSQPAPTMEPASVAAASQARGPVPQTAAAAAPADEAGVAYIKSPMVGTFYRSASPDSPPFVDINSKVQETTPVCIIEAMKIMNEIHAELKGTIVETLVENGQPVEFGQRLFKVKS